MAAAPLGVIPWLFEKSTATMLSASGDSTARSVGAVVVKSV